MKWFTLLVVAMLVPASAVAQGEPAEDAIVVSEAVTYGPIEIPGFDSGMQIAVVHGDPNAETGDYTLRLKFPAGYSFPVHWHPMGEHLTVLSGTFLLAMGNTTDEAAVQTYQPGTFIYIPGEHPHYGGAEEETVIQLHGQNPFKIVLPE